jgi:hypothetical protein
MANIGNESLQLSLHDQRTSHSLHSSLLPTPLSLSLLTAKQGHHQDLRYTRSLHAAHCMLLIE